MNQDKLQSQNNNMEGHSSSQIQIENQYNGQNYQQQYSQYNTQVNNNSVQPRQISAEEVMGKQQMTQQELQETQVLNLKDVQEVARIEKLTSKKPAVIVAVIGILLLTIGTSFKVVESLNSKNSKIEERKIQTNKNKEVLATTELKCSKIVVNNPDGTDTMYDVSYSFKSNRLIGFTKVFSINAIAGNQVAMQTMQGYAVGYQSFLNQLDGYSITVTQSQDLTQIISTVKADLLKLDLKKLPEIQQTHFSTKVDYVAGTEKEIIQNEMLAQGFICQ